MQEPCDKHVRHQNQIAGHVHRSVLASSELLLLLQDVYADMSNNLLVYVHVPALGLRSKQWTVISWARSQTARESLLDAKYVYRSEQATNVTAHFMRCQSLVAACLAKSRSTPSVF